MDSYNGRKKKDNKKKKTFEIYGKNTARGLRIKEEKQKSEHSMVYVEEQSGNKHKGKKGKNGQK